MAIKKGGDGDDNGGGDGDEWFSYSYDILTLRWKEAALLSGKGEDVTRHQWKMMAVMIVRIVHMVDMRIIWILRLMRIGRIVEMVIRMRLDWNKEQTKCSGWWGWGWGWVFWILMIVKMRMMVTRMRLNWNGGQRCKKESKCSAGTRTLPPSASPEGEESSWSSGSPGSSRSSEYCDHVHCDRHNYDHHLLPRNDRGIMIRRNEDVVDNHDDDEVDNVPWS